MRLDNWDGVATVTAGVALVVLALMPSEKEPFDLDAQVLHQAGQEALELSGSGTAVSWDDAGSGLSGSVMPLRVFRNAEGQWCRRFVITIEGDGNPVVLNRTACRRYDGEWRTVVEPAAQVADVGS